MYCTHCGHANPEGSNYCANCGRPLRLASEETTGSLRAEDVDGLETGDLDQDIRALVAELEAGTALLLVVRGPNYGARFLLDREVVTVGRHPSSDIFLDDITVSRRHAEFRREDGRFWVYDVGSLNGTYVNSERTEDARLETGDEVQVGKFKLLALVAEAS